MLIAIATSEQYVSPHFGRCQEYTLVEIVNGKVTKKGSGCQSRTCTGCDS